MVWRLSQPNRQMLDNVRLNGRGGLILPTGRKSDPDRLFAFAFGHDGATGILFGVVLMCLWRVYYKSVLTLNYYIYLAIRVKRRIKVAI